MSPEVILLPQGLEQTGGTNIWFGPEQIVHGALEASFSSLDTDREPVKTRHVDVAASQAGNQVGLV